MLNAKLENLRARLRSLESAVVAFSGGVDSAVLVCVAHEAMNGKMAAVTADSPSVPSRDIEAATSFCKKRGIPHLVIKTREFENENYVSNPPDRCFYCKSELFDSLDKVARERGFKYVIEGTNASEILGHRPGYLAARRRKSVATPYVELGLTKDDIRAIAKGFGLEVAERPSTACLSSRIPTGTKIDEDILRRIDEAENFLIGLGVKQVRLRHHNGIARIEVGPEDFERCVARRGEIAENVLALGWKYVTLDLVGYRTGGGR